MKTVIFDFNDIENLSIFYRRFQKEFKLNSTMANNLDSLWDALTGYIEIPVKIEFINLTLFKLDKFSRLITLFEEAEEETDHKISFTYFISNSNI
ncbi:hypothetical protein ETU08_01670 [Apibacter muscae]|uniref:Barstar (barnase inhibitor) domain-containing protein n=1 Tax=Apibacter muscae TaxID=2509004 RepID=A0A563DKG5_9FLAO|nr:barstar family protein [Apibacter muscae]TWP25120.1 hypothetical protein ETU10_00355 [Apibacter muscae]TWP30670.1 hypothetical protein ETU09_01320 [Apibacter muscae]TWP31213.1 hypothetical protein ETU08_01670 [Apibacter muscae]